MEVSPSQISDFMRFLNHGNWVFNSKKGTFMEFSMGFSPSKGDFQCDFLHQKIWIKLIKVLHGIWVPLHRHPAGCTMRVSASPHVAASSPSWLQIHSHAYIAHMNIHMHIQCIYIYILCISYIDSAWYHTTIYHKSIVYSVYRNHLFMIHLSYILYSQKTVAMLSYINKIAMFKTLYQSVLLIGW